MTDGLMTTTVLVYFDDCQGRLVDGKVVDRADWSEWATKRQAVDPDRRGVVRVGGVEHIVVPIVTAAQIYWKAI
jgi:hypothetical protein